MTRKKFTAPTFNLDPRDALSPSQLVVFQRLAAGARNDEIAAELKVSTKTIDSHRGASLRKLGLRHNVDAAMCALAWGLMEMPRPVLQAPAA